MSETQPSSPASPTPESIIVAGPESKPTKPKPPAGKSRRRKWILIIAGTVVLAAAAGAAGWILAGPKAPVATIKPKPTASPTPTPTPVTKLSPLTGLPVDPALANRPITGIVIENHTDARPQSGLSQAGVVYEANAEGGITRFIAFFLDQRPPSLGPVRSLRTYFIDWALEFNAPVAHAGGNADALDLVGPLGLKDMNALSFASSAFFRTTDRVAPHNLYTTSDKLDALEKTLHFNQPASFPISPRKPDAPSASAPHPNIHIDYSYAGYQVDYRYDPATNDYGRLLSGAPHIDRNTGKQIRVKNVVVEMMPTSYGTTRIGESTVIMPTVGRGQGWVLRDGDAIAITWVKDSHNGRTKLLDAIGNDVPLNAGNTWYSIVPVGKNVTF